MTKKSSGNTSAYLEKARREISEWEGAKRGYLSQWGDRIFHPAAQMTSSLVPKNIQKSATQLIEQTLRLTAQAGQFSVDTAAITRERKRLLGRRRSPASHLQICDELAKRFWNSHTAYAATQGAAVGVAGLAGVLADIPLLLSIAIREIRTIGLCYGYPTMAPEETNYVLHILRLSSCSEQRIRAKYLKEMKKLESALAGAQKQPIGGCSPARRTGRVKYLMTIREYSKTLAIEFIQRGALNSVPLAGLVTGASLNAFFANDLGRTSWMCYRRRFLDQALMSWNPSGRFPPGA